MGLDLMCKRLTPSGFRGVAEQQSGQRRPMADHLRSSSMASPAVASMGMTDGWAMPARSVAILSMSSPQAAR
jgi:hypothetical protein